MKLYNWIVIQKQQKYLQQHSDDMILATKINKADIKLLSGCYKDHFVLHLGEGHGLNRNWWYLGH